MKTAQDLNFAELQLAYKKAKTRTEQDALTRQLHAHPEHPRNGGHVPRRFRAIEPGDMIRRINDKTPARVLRSSAARPVTPPVYIGAEVYGAGLADNIREYNHSFYYVGTANAWLLREV